MAFWIVIAVLIVIIIAFNRIRIGVNAEVTEKEISLSAVLLGKKIKVFPRKKKQKAPAPPKEKPPKPEAEKKKRAHKKPDFQITFDDVIDLLKCVLKGLGKFGRVRIDRFMFHFLAASSDPYRTAMMFGHVNAALSALAPVAKERYQCKDLDIYTAVDFTAEQLRLEFGFTATIRIGQIFAVLNSILFGGIPIALRILIRTRKARKSGHSDQPSDDRQNTETINSADTEDTIRKEDGNDGE